MLNHRIHILSYHWYLDVHLKWHGSDIWVKVEERRGTTAEPLRDVLGIGQRRAQSDDTDCLSNLWWDVPHTRTDHFKHRLDNHPHRLLHNYMAWV